jgi:hypothetical protein
MKETNQEFLSHCSDIDFGAVRLSAGEMKFYQKLNNEILLLCKSLPKSIQTDALLFYMDYSRVSFGERLNFFKYYFAPVWSTLYWLIYSQNGHRRLSQEDINCATTGHSMAMTLHSMDNHLYDGEIPVTHLSLLLRSQAWMIMNRAFSYLVDGNNERKEIVTRFINDYYSSISRLDGTEALNAYCARFLNQMATGFIAPVLVANRKNASNEFTQAIQAAYGSFGIAWRLLDDIKDIYTDMTRGVQSSIYSCLPKTQKIFWDKLRSDKLDNREDYTRVLFDYIVREDIIGTLKERIYRELLSAASIANDLNLKSLANEFLCLLRPFKSGQCKV